MDYGSDLKLDINRDVIFTPDGDIETISKAALVVQDIREELSIGLKSVLWDSEAGSDILDNLNAANVSDVAILNELERVALKDTRIDASTIEVTKVKFGNYQLAFTVVGTTNKQILLFDLEKFMGGNDD